MNKIPKVIHYCWFGYNPFPEKMIMCINSWKRYLPDYKIVEWNEDNFDIHINDYVQEAYKAKKYAFVSDYVRLYAIYYYGGIYMDTDVEVLQSLTPFLDNIAFSGFEANDSIPTGIIASRKGCKIIKKFLSYYEDRHFTTKLDHYDMTTNVYTITTICKKYGLRLNGKKQNIKGMVVYPQKYFCPNSLSMIVLKKPKGAYTIHHFAGTWNNSTSKRGVLFRTKKYFISKIRNLIGTKRVFIIGNYLKRKIEG